MPSLTTVQPSGTLRLPEAVDRETWSGMMTDADLWQPVVDDICTAVGIVRQDRPVAGYPGSSSVFVVGETAVIKLYPPLFARDFEVERWAYQLLHDRTEAIPHLIDAGIYRDRIDWPFLVTGFCSGEPVRTLFGELAAQQRAEIARQVGEIMRSVHQTSILDQGTLPPWPEFLAERRRACLIELRRDTPLPTSLIAEIERFLNQMTPQLRKEPGVLLNADLTDDHVLLAPVEDSWRVQAIIDWADAELGPLAYEWIAAWFGFCRRDPAMFATLLSAYSPGHAFDDDLRRQLLACTFLHRFGPHIINDLWQRNPPEELTLAGLQDWLWPGVN